MEKNLKLEDRKKILAYLEDKKQVSVEELLANSGAERLRVYPLLFELTQEKIIRILKESDLGAPEIICLY